MYLGHLLNVPGADFQKRDGANEAHRFRVRLPSEPALVCDVIYRSVPDLEDGDVRVQWLEDREAEGSPRHYHRLGIYRLDGSRPGDSTQVIQLRLVGTKANRPQETTLRKASMEEIAVAARVPDPGSHLLSVGGSRVGRRADLGWFALRRNDFLAVTFSRDQIWTPIVALVLCVVLPVYHGAAQSVR